jgi:hypothetical protein
MAFSLSGLTPGQHVSGVQSFPIVWDYSTSDTIATVEAGSYFDTADALKALRQADWIRVTASDGKAIYFVDGAALSSPDIGIIKQAVVTSFT